MDLEKAFFAIQDQLRIAEMEYTKTQLGLRQEVERNINRFMATLDITKTVADLREAHVKAGKLMIEEKERKAQAGENAPYPIGTKMKCTKLVRRHGRYRGDETTIYGVVEGVTRDTVLPMTMGCRSWRKPAIGSYIVRILKADGTPGKNFEELYDRWTPMDETIQRNVPVLQVTEEML
jgi:hypothetical protein